MSMEIWRFVFALGGLALFLALELLFPYRPPTQSKVRRWEDNLSMAALNGVILYLAFAAPTMATVHYAASHGSGILNILDIPYGIKILLTVVFFDFMLYVWHLLNHEAPFLWRFHRVHHCDLNMDVSTATRFHVGELALSAVIRMGLIYFWGAELLGLVLFESLVVAASQFHHSSLRVPKAFERLFWILFVPPSMHRIHHSVIIRERNTNYGTIFSLWDRILGTLKSDVDQNGIRIGVGAYPQADQLRLRRLLRMPFEKPVR